MPITTDFPDYPAADFPALPAGFEDSSWGNDACPSMTNEKAGLLIYADFLDPQQRETPESKRFSVHVLDEDGCITDGGMILATDEWADVLRHILVRSIADKFAELLLRDLGPTKFAEMKALNETEAFADLCCASQNYLDANMTMDEALTEIRAHGLVFNSDADTALWNDAWENARDRHIGKPLGKKA